MYRTPAGFARRDRTVVPARPVPNEEHVVVVLYEGGRSEVVERFESWDAANTLCYQLRMSSREAHPGAVWYAVMTASALERTAHGDA